MAAPAYTLTTAIAVNGTTYRRVDEVETIGQIVAGRTLAAGKAATLTTRTDNDTGILTVASGHGILDTDYVCFSWVDATTGDLQCRFRLDVTAVTSTTISIDAGTGVNLPTANTVGVVSVVQNSPFEVDVTQSSPDATRPDRLVFVNASGSGTSAVVAMLGIASEAGAGTYTNVKLLYADTPTGTAFRYADLGDFEAFSTSIDTIYYANAATVESVITAMSFYRS